MTFKELDLSESTLQALADMGIHEPTEIQEKSIPYLLQAPVDFIGLAQTGTGKTAAFVIPLVELILKENRNHISALVIVPTRELCLQITEVIQNISKKEHAIKVTSVYGGTGIVNQIKELKKQPALVVATPGRLIDLIGRKAIDISKIKYVILDEADEMLNMGFQEDIDKILAAIQTDHSTWLFSATMPKPIRKLVDTYMDQPEEVSIIQDQKVNQNIEHQYVVCKSSDKLMSLMAILSNEPDFYGIIFCRTKRSTTELADELQDYSFNAEVLNGDMSQNHREHVMKRFRNKNTQIIVATDVAARGIDVDDLTHIVHYHLPDDLSYYTHRSGRTARAGKKGISLIMSTKSDRRKINELGKQLDIELQQIKIPAASEIQLRQVQNWAREIKEIDGSKVSDELIDAALECFDEMDGVDLLSKLIVQLLENKSKITLEAPSKAQGDFENMFVGVGKNDKMTKKGLVQLLVKNSTLKSNEIGPIRMMRRHAIVGIKPEVMTKTIRQLKGLKIKKRKVQVREDRKS